MSLASQWPGGLGGILANSLGLGPIPATKVEGACASGGIAFRHACLSVAAGLTDYAMAIGVEKMTHENTNVVTEALNSALDRDIDGKAGYTFPGLYSLAWRLHENITEPAGHRSLQSLEKTKGLD